MNDHDRSNTGGSDDSDGSNDSSGRNEFDSGGEPALDRGTLVVFLLIVIVLAALTYLDSR